MKNIRMIAILVTLPVGVPALAQERPYFNGARVEGQLGWDRLQNHGHRDGLSYGIGAGYDLQHDTTVLGLETEFADSTTKRCRGSRTLEDPRICDKAARDIYVGGRFGKVVGKRSLLYAKVGYDNSRIKTVFNNGDERFSLGRNTLDGVRLGAGAEYALGRHSFIKAEYRYTNSENHWSRNQLVSGIGLRF